MEKKSLIGWLQPSPPDWPAALPIMHTRVSHGEAHTAVGSDAQNTSARVAETAFVFISLSPKGGIHLHSAVESIQRFTQAQHCDRRHGCDDRIPGVRPVMREFEAEHGHRDQESKR
ncbi:hypothetical protein DP44_5683 [Burkholderia pseudomallei]|nr:hypothetical protein DP44_5683 [Burkholderia pseudomallei]